MFVASKKLGRELSSHLCCAFQKTENLPATGQIDSQTAERLGITQDCVAAKRTAHDGAKAKPWAGTRVENRIKEPCKTLPKIVATGIDH